MYHVANKTELAVFNGGTLDIFSTCNDYQVHPDLIVGTFYTFYLEYQASKQNNRPSYM